MEKVLTIREQIVSVLRGEVMAGGFDEGEPLREQSLATRFGVSRGPIRDALLQLTKEGLLVARPNCGVTVNKATSEVIRPLLLRIRRDVEVFALERLLKASIEDAEAKAWDGHLAAFKVACGKGDLPRAVQLDMAFHRSIVVRGGGEDLVSVWLPVMTRMMLRYSRHHNLSESHGEHMAIVDAIRRRARARARRLLSDHIQ